MEWPSLSTGHSLKRKERYLYEHVRHSTAWCLLDNLAFP